MNLTIGNRIDLFKLELSFQLFYRSSACLMIKVACRVRVAYLKDQYHDFFTIFRNKFLKHVFNIILKLNTHP